MEDTLGEGKKIKFTKKEKVIANAFDDIFAISESAAFTSFFCISCPAIVISPVVDHAKRPNPK